MDVSPDWIRFFHSIPSSEFSFSLPANYYLEYVAFSRLYSVVSAVCETLFTLFPE